MKKLFLLIIMGLLVGLAASWYGNFRNTAKRATGAFTQELITGQVEAAYARLSPDLAKGREQYWRDYLAQFKTDTPSELMRSETVNDTFNTYLEDNNPQRLTYRMQLGDHDYELTIVTVKAGQNWVVEALYGSNVGS